MLNKPDLSYICARQNKETKKFHSAYYSHHYTPWQTNRWFNAANTNDGFVTKKEAQAQMQRFRSEIKLTCKDIKKLKA